MFLDSPDVDQIVSCGIGQEFVYTSFRYTNYWVLLIMKILYPKQ